jgi:hypothetical protein
LRKYFSAQNAKFIDNGFITLQHAICRRECRFFECCKSVLKSYHFPLKKPCRVYTSFKIAILICFLFFFFTDRNPQFVCKEKISSIAIISILIAFKNYIQSFDSLCLCLLLLFLSSFILSFFKFVFCNQARKTNISSYCPSVDVCHLCLYLNRIESRICFSPSKNVGCIYFGKNMHSIFLGEKNNNNFTQSTDLTSEQIQNSNRGSRLTSLMFKIFFLVKYGTFKMIFMSYFL